MVFVVDKIIIFDSVVLIVVVKIDSVVDVAEMLLRLWEDESFEKTWLSDWLSDWLTSEKVTTR